MHEKESVQIAAASRRAINTALNGNPGLVGCMPAKVIKVAASLILMATSCRHHAYDMPPACLAIHPQNVRQDDRVFPTMPSKRGERESWQLSKAPVFRIRDHQRDPTRYINSTRC